MDHTDMVILHKNVQMLVQNIDILLYKIMDGVVVITVGLMQLNMVDYYFNIYILNIKFN